MKCPHLFEKGKSRKKAYFNKKNTLWERSTPSYTRGLYEATDTFLVDWPLAAPSVSGPYVSSEETLGTDVEVHNNATSTDALIDRATMQTGSPITPLYVLLYFDFWIFIFTLEEK